VNRTLKLQGDCYLEGEDLRQGGACFQQVVDYYHNTKDTAEELRTWQRWADCITWIHPAEKMNCYTQALKLIPDSTSFRRLEFYEDIGLFYTWKPEQSRQDLDKAMWYFSAGERLSRRLSRDRSRYHFIVLMGSTYLLLNDTVNGKK